MALDAAGEKVVKKLNGMGSFRRVLCLQSSGGTTNILRGIDQGKELASPRIDKPSGEMCGLLEGEYEPF